MTSSFRTPPARHPDEGSSFTHLSRNGNVYFLVHHFGSPDTTLLGGQLYIVPRPGPPAPHWQSPDLLIAFDVDPELYHQSNGYVISEQGKPPDFVLEVASESTAKWDLGVKRDYYAAFGIPEYWRFDETGEYYGDRLAGERLVDGVYEPFEIERLSEDTLQGHSDVLDLDIRWHDGRLEWYGPETGRHIVTFDDERARADGERAARIQAEAPKPRARGGAAATARRVGPVGVRNRRPVPLDRGSRRSARNRRFHADRAETHAQGAP